MRAGSGGQGLTVKCVCSVQELSSQAPQEAALRPTSSLAQAGGSHVMALPHWQVGILMQHDTHMQGTAGSRELV